eukprot:4096635-Amphidinium_carterae.1
MRRAAAMGIGAISETMTDEDAGKLLQDTMAKMFATNQGPTWSDENDPSKRRSLGITTLIGGVDEKGERMSYKEATTQRAGPDISKAPKRVLSQGVPKDP